MLGDLFAPGDFSNTVGDWAGNEANKGGGAGITLPEFRPTGTNAHDRYTHRQTSVMDINIYMFTFILGGGYF